MIQASIVQKPETLDAPVSQDYNHVLERRHKHRYADRPTFWYSPFTGQVTRPDETKVNIPANTPLTTLLEKIEQYTLRKYGEKKRVASLYLVAGRDSKNRPNWNWFDVYRGWTRKRLFKSSLLAEYNHSGFKVLLYGTGNYFGEETNIDAMHEALNTLEQKLEQVFNADGYKLLGDTPAQTGRELLLVSLPKEKRYPRLPDDILETIIHNFGQGRIETFSPKQEILENGVYTIDGRWMYASCLSHLPVGPCYHDKQNEFLGVYTKEGKLAPKCPGFYNVTVRVPENWYHIGLIKAPQRKIRTDKSGYYPNTPGETFTNWTTANELALALDNGWHIHINERIVWPYEETDLLAMWRRKLVDFRAEIEQELDKHYSLVGALHKDAIRSIVLHTIGSFHKVYTFEDHVTPGEELPLPPNVKPYGTPIRILKGLSWREAIPLSSFRQPFIHPEWSATVWGRARAKLAEFSLRLPYEDIVSLMTDCVWCASLPEWVAQEDTEKPGCFRQKGDKVPGPWNWPKKHADMVAFAIKHNRETFELKLRDDDLDELED